MSNIENLSRPFNLLERLRPAGKTTKPEPKDADDVLLSFGSPGDNVFQISASNQQDINNDDKQEVRRTYDVVKVKNTEDPDQFVQVEVMTEYQARNRIDEKRTKVRFSKQEATANIDIVSRNKVRTTED